jgi:hypothetical protein
MKKCLLFASSAFFMISAFAQTNTEVGIGLTNQARIDQDQNYTPIKQTAIPNEKAATVVNIGSSYNVFTILGDRQNQVVYNPDINTVAFCHRQNDGAAGGSGIISWDYSTDGGATWTINPFQTTPTGSGTSWNGNRYPNMALYNPAANTNPANAYMVQVGPGLETGTGSGQNGWANTFQASALFNGTNLSETYVANTTSALSDDNEWGAGGLYTNANGVVWYASTNTNNTNITSNDVADNYSKYFITKGVFNSTNNNFDWTLEQTITPTWVTTDNNGTQYNMSGLMNMAWSPDGNTGYMVIMGAWGSNTMWRPYVMKTTDAGATWNNVNDYDFSQNSIFQCMVYPSDLAQPLSIRPWFSDFDMVVGSDNELRIFVDVQSQSSAHPDSLLYAYTARQSHGLYEVATNGSGWTVTLVDSVMVDDYEWDATNQLSHYVRPQASRSQDGTKIFYSWLSSDPITAATDRSFPDVFSRGHDLTSGNWTAITNLTTGTPANFIAAYQTVAVDVIENGTEKAYELPIVYGTDLSGATLSDGLVAVRWNFIRGVGFDASDFNSSNNPATDPCAVGIGEEAINNSNLTVFPNPATGIVTIGINDVNEFNYTIVDILGNVVATDNVKGDKVVLDLTNNAKGVYFVQVEVENTLISRKLVLTK